MDDRERARGCVEALEKFRLGEHVRVYVRDQHDEDEYVLAATGGQIEGWAQGDEEFLSALENDGIDEAKAKDEVYMYFGGIQMCMPVWADDELVAIIYVDNVGSRAPGDLFSQQDALDLDRVVRSVVGPYVEEPLGKATLRSKG